MRAVVRVLVAIEPRMYREVLAFHISQKRSRSEVILVSPENLQDEAEHTRPHLIIANEVSPELKQMGSYWVEVHEEDGLVATIRANGYFTTIHDVSLENLLAVVDKAEEELAHDDEE
jgi:hypothetical protein